jgi:hypothetical protein
LLSRSTHHGHGARWLHDALIGDARAAQGIWRHASDR